MFSILLTGFSFSLLIHFSHLGYWKRHKEFYYDHGTPLMSTLDAYYYLRMTSQLLQAEEAKAIAGYPSGRSLKSVPLLASVTALIHKITNFPIEQIAFYLPPVLGSCMAIIYICWGHSLGGPTVALLASLAGLSSFYWYTRTCLGRYDTDCLNPFFVFSILFLVYRFVVCKGSVRVFYLTAAFAVAWAFDLWWTQVGHLGFILLILSYSTSCYISSAKAERFVKIALLIMIAGTLLIIFTDFLYVLPDRMVGFITPYASQLALIKKSNISNSVFPDVGKSISELQPLHINAMAREVGGHLVPFAISMIGLFFVLKRNKDASCFLLVGFLLASLSLTARRFLIFFIPLYALGLGYFIGEIVLKGKLLQRLAKPPLKWSLCLLLAAVLLSPNLYLSLTRDRGPSLTAGDVFLARSIRNESGKKAVVWAWWDYGYFLEYITGKRVFIDGGTQAPDRTLVAAFPLTCGDPVLAGNWMRFFAAHDLDGLYGLAHYLGSVPKTFSFLKEVLASPDRSPQILESYGLIDKEAWNRYLFPDVPVFLYINADLINKTYWWYYFGTWNPERRAGTHPEFRAVRIADPDGFMDSKGMEIDGLTEKIAELVEVGQNGSVIKKIGRQSSVKNSALHSGGSVNAVNNDMNRESGRVAVKIEDSHLVYILDVQLVQALAFRLSFLHPRHTPGFDPLVYSPRTGGVWRVE